MEIMSLLYHGDQAPATLSVLYHDDPIFTLSWITSLLYHGDHVSAISWNSYLYYITGITHLLHIGDHVSAICSRPRLCCIMPQMASSWGQHGAHLSAPGGPHVGPMNLASKGGTRICFIMEIMSLLYIGAHPCATPWKPRLCYIMVVAICWRSRICFIKEITYLLDHGDHVSAMYWRLRLCYIMEIIPLSHHGDRTYRICCFLESTCLVYHEDHVSATSMQIISLLHQCRSCLCYINADHVSVSSMQIMSLLHQCRSCLFISCLLNFHLSNCALFSV